MKFLIDANLPFKLAKSLKDKGYNIIHTDELPDKERTKEILSLMIENYENEHYPIEAPDPIEAIKIRMEELNLRQKDLVGVIGGKSRVSEILNRKKKLTVEMIRELERILQISASVLVNNYKLVKK